MAERWCLGAEYVRQIWVCSKVSQFRITLGVTVDSNNHNVTATSLARDTRSIVHVRELYLGRNVSSATAASPEDQRDIKLARHTSLGMFQTGKYAGPGFRSSKSQRLGKIASLT
jgi:hypothetical protein